MKLFVDILVFVLFSLLLSCNNSKTKKQEFEENLDKYIESCIPPFIEKGADTLSAKGLCLCLMEKMFAMDSTIFTKSMQKDKNELNDIVNKYSAEFIEECKDWFDEIDQLRSQREKKE